MNVSFFIARRYLLSKKSTNAINIISMISIGGIFIGTAALIIILSVFNGFEGIALSMYNSFSPDVKIEIREGKSFDPTTSAFQKIGKLPGISLVVKSLEEKAELVYDDRHTTATLKGMSAEFEKNTALDTMMIDGHRKLQDGIYDYAVMGAGIQSRLSVHAKDFYPITAYSPMRHSSSIIPGQDQNINQGNIYPEGVFSIQEDYDNEYVLTSLRFVRKLLNEPVLISSLEIYTAKGVDIEALKEKIAALAGPRFSVKDRIEQNEVLFKVLMSEKWAVYLILTFILIIAIFNVMGSLTMLVIEKKKDISILSGMGASNSLIRRIFLTEGLMISLIGAFGGLLLGWLVCVLQQKFGFITIGNGKSFVVSAYPVILAWKDFLYVFLTVFSISLLACVLASGSVFKKNTSLIEDLSMG